MSRRLVLTKEQVKAIRAEYRPGVPGCGYLALARKYGIGASTVRDLVKYYQQGYA